ncbi:hypothetical protein AA313_de0200317 [Arthrobotrys entomopaga]|nr:hypothetical protein AA313_de0200317 [Arthrobotrys entomopaga]
MMISSASFSSEGPNLAIIMHQQRIPCFDRVHDCTIGTSVYQILISHERTTEAENPNRRREMSRLQVPFIMKFSDYLSGNVRPHICVFDDTRIEKLKKISSSSKMPQARHL